MKNDKESLEATKKLKKAIKQGVDKMSQETLLLVFKLSELKETLGELEKYKAVGINSIIKKYEMKLESFEGLIDKKYWDDYALFYIITALSCRVANSLEEAINMFEEFKKGE